MSDSYSLLAVREMQWWTGSQLALSARGGRHIVMGAPGIASNREWASDNAGNTHGRSAASNESRREEHVGKGGKTICSGCF